VQAGRRQIPAQLAALNGYKSVELLPESDSRAISQAALLGLTSIYQPGYRYAKAGVMLLELNDASVGQGELALEDEAALLRQAGGPRLMQALDAVNKRYGRGAMLLASAGLAGDRRVWVLAPIHF